jgi:carbamoyl-phosphate synthase large subunit
VTAGTWVELAAGVALLVVAAYWQSAVRRRSQSFLQRALSDDDPTHRVAALDVLAARGVERHVPLLLERIHNERDETVLRALAETVARNQWLPVDRADVAELRMWAARHLQSVPAEPVAAPPPLAVAPERKVIAPTPAADVAPIGEGIRVLVTGAGGPAGVSVIRALTAAGHHVIAVDADPTAVGLRLAPDSAVVPRSDAVEFIDAVRAVGVEHRAAALISTVAEEMARLGEARRELAEAGMAMWLPSPTTVNDCIDKWAFAKVMKKAGLPVPATGLGNANGVPGPWIVKPRFGRGSRDVVSADSAARLWWALDVVPDPIVQTRCDGREFTVDALVDPGGALVASVARWRVETKAGISTKGVTFVHAGVTEAVGNVLQALGLLGPANVQGFVAEDDSVTIIEVNPRFSGGLPLSIAAGSDLVGQYLNAILGRPVRADRLTYRPDVRMLRYFEEVIESDSTTQSDGTAQSDGTTPSDSSSESDGAAQSDRLGEIVERRMLHFDALELDEDMDDDPPGAATLDPRENPDSEEMGTESIGTEEMGTEPVNSSRS